MKSLVFLAAVGGVLITLVPFLLDLVFRVRYGFQKKKRRTCIVTYMNTYMNAYVHNAYIHTCIHT